MRNSSNVVSLIDFLKIRYRPLICPFDQLLSYIEDGDRVADIGCGSGQFCMLAAQRTHASAISGIEIDPQLIANATQGLQRLDRTQRNISFALYDGTSFPDTIAHCDVVFMIDVLHHIPPAMQPSFLDRLHGHMRPGARLVLKDIDAGSWLVGFNRMHDLLLSGELGHEWTVAEAMRRCGKVGFQILESRRLRMFVYPHFLLHLQKTR